MKTQLHITIILLLLSFSINAQVSKQIGNNPVSSQNEKTFFEIQKSFNDYWAPYHVTNGYYTENDVQKRAPGWKQFKRWEYYWENRVDPQTGEFPKVRASDIYAQLTKQRGTNNANGAWTSLGPSSSPGGYEGIGRINCVAFRPGDNNTYYAGSPSGGLWKTTDNGSSWSVLTDNNAVLGVSDAVVLAGSTTATDTIYIATGDRDGGTMWLLGSGNFADNNSVGILKSTDGGSSWSTTGLSFTADQKMIVNRLLADPTNHNILYAAVSDGVYKSTDAGVTWSKITNYIFIDLEFKPNNSQIIYAGTKVGYIYKSTDGGATWSEVLNKYADNGRRINLSVTPANSEDVYAVIANTSGGLLGVYKSTDSGTSFSLVYNSTNLLDWKTDGSGTTGQGGYDLAIAVSPTDTNTLYVGGINTHKSTDGGTTWNAVNCWTPNSNWNNNGAPVVHADKHMLKFRASDNTLFETNDGGIYYTTDGGSSWTDKTNGIVPSQIYRLSNAATSSTEVITGLQDNGTKTLSGGTWDLALGGDGMECIIDYTDINTQYGETPNGNIYRTINHWVNSYPISGIISESGHWVTPYCMDPNDHLTLYAGYENIWKSTDQGTNWTKISSINTSQRLRSLAVAHSNPQVIYTADPDNVWVTTDGGTSWTDITGTLPVSSSSITYISIKYDDPNTAWVSFGQYNSDGVYQTTDGGTTWTNISAGLPAIPVMCVIQNRQNTTQTELYAGTDLGVYVKVGSSNWTAFNSGLPNVVVDELEIYYDDNDTTQSGLRAATSGRGLWESELFSPPSSPPVADFTADNANPIVGDTVSFTDLSTNVPTSWLWSFSPSTITYVNGTNSSSTNPQVKFNNAGTYSVQLIATNSYGSDTATKNNYINVLATYCAAEGGGGGIYIQGVQIGTINNTGTGSDGYYNYTNLSTDILIGEEESITVTNGASPSYGYDDLGIWIDFNRDGNFDDVEKVVCDINGYATGTFSFTVPDNATEGITTMRVRIKNSGSNCGTSCGTSQFGEVEDYAVYVKRGSSTWVGTTTAWDTPSNWSQNKIPTSSYDVTIPTSPTGGNFPVVPTGYTAKCHTLTLDSNATITVNGTLQVEQ